METLSDTNYHSKKLVGDTISETEEVLLTAINNLNNNNRLLIIENGDVYIQIS